ncbi:hypothetical protein [Flavobacterium reichenbachii]|uniref:Lipoprotein n=1 Tax=Flavobacterium reichenbachii TaxID=362418 RepID=A0A085ZDU9_9FLAO|nr:hypothetical protein [Flavobacterium reichenbachii]KFF02613.1 hypothetical protein IW19_23375 [Flavobacterium reichenbachii]OXB15871.1 hypothetical protein B0A68_08940 [Flavobacterium reichenbachii]
MLKKIVILTILTSISCQTTKIKNDNYKFSSSTVELGSIGTSKLSFNQNTFESRGLANLENNIRLEIGIIPYNKKLNKIYKSKAKYNQTQRNITYTDSLPIKPELVTIKISDITSLVQEINSDHNTPILKLLTDTQNLKIISSLAVNLPADDITKIRQSDAYYLTNTQYKKYTIALYKAGKKTDIIDVNPETIVAYQVSSFCWVKSIKSNWYVADIVNENNTCSGITERKIKEKKNDKDLFDM